MKEVAYSKALRCTFFGEWKNSCSSKFVQLGLLNNANGKTSKKRAAQGFHYINLCISNFLDPIQKRAFSRSVQLEAVYLEALLYSIFPQESETSIQLYTDYNHLQAT